MTDRDAILGLNETFYRAYAQRDYKAMDDIWADELPVSCIHPGWPPLFGRAEVMMSWRDLLKSPSGDGIRASDAAVTVCGNTALVLCREVLGGRRVLTAVNLFAREDGVWRLVHHQSGPGADILPAHPVAAVPSMPRHLH